MRNEIHVNGLGVSRISVHSADIIGATSTHKAAPDGAETPYAEGLAETLLGGPTVNNRSNLRTDSRKRIAAEYLGIASRDLARATVDRIRYIALAREYGLTYTEIGDALGVSEKAARSLLSRNCDIAGGEHHHLV